MVSYIMLFSKSLVVGSGSGGFGDIELSSGLKFGLFFSFGYVDAKVCCLIEERMFAWSPFL